jgi:monofunctional glycosyltransferase
MAAMHAVWQRFLLAIAAFVFVLLIAPYLIAPFYRFINPISTPMLWRWATGGRVDRLFVPLDHMAPALPLSVIIAEDGSFCHNRGIDLGALREAIEESDDDIARARGGSTITQQTAKNLFLWSGRSFVRKALEFPLAIWLYLVLPKQRLIEIYLNVVEWGPHGEFGAEAASRFAFSKPARDLTAREAAELAAILPNPIRRSARTPGSIVQRLAGLYEKRAAAHPGLGACVRLRVPAS